VHVLFSGAALLAVALSSEAYVAHVAVSILSAWLFCSLRLAGGEALSPYGLFLASSVLFAGGQSFLEAVNHNPNGFLDGRYSEDLVQRTLFATALGLAALHAGGLAAVARRRSQPPPPAFESSQWGVLVVGRTLLALAIPPAAALLWETRGVVMEGGYGALYQRDASMGLSATPQILALLLVPGVLFTYVGARHSRAERLIASALLFVYCAAQIAIGYRASGAMPLAAWLWLRHASGRTVSRRLLGLSAVLLFGVLPLVREVRVIPGAERDSIRFFRDAFESIGDPVRATLSEFGGTARVLADTISLVPSTRAFDYGTSYWYAAMTLLPNFFWDVHPTVAHGTASDWLVWTLEPASAAAGGGIGYSNLAEGYLNFGIIGVALSMFVIGFGFGLAQRWATDPAKLAVVAVVTAFLLRWPRDEVAAMVRPVLWFAVTPYFTARLINALANRRSAPRWVRLRTLARPVPQHQRRFDTQPGTIGRSGHLSDRVAP
jgi:hypothetical protein